MTARARQVLLGALPLAFACSGDTVNLGRSQRELATPVFDGAKQLDGINSPEKDENPTLTADELELYFNSSRSGNADIWVARRANREAAFEEPRALDELNSEALEGSPAIDADGLTLWFSSNREGGSGKIDIWFSRRTDRNSDWGTPMEASELNSSEDDIPRPIGAHGTRMLLASRRAGGDYLTYSADRDAALGGFKTPRLLSSLSRDGVSTVDAFLQNDGSYALYVHALDGVGDLYWARTHGPEFDEEAPLDSLNTSFDDRDPWLSPDGRTLYFASDREEQDLNIYVAQRTPNTP